MKHLIFTATVRMNEKEAPFDGGRLLLHCDDAEANAAEFLQVEVILNASTDEALAAFPSTRAEMESRKFQVTITEL
jgi:hypothetical protein